MPIYKINNDNQIKCNMHTANLELSEYLDNIIEQINPELINLEEYSTDWIANINYHFANALNIAVNKVVNSELRTQYLNQIFIKFNTLIEKFNGLISNCSDFDKKLALNLGEKFLYPFIITFSQLAPYQEDSYQTKIQKSNYRSFQLFIEQLQQIPDFYRAQDKEKNDDDATRHNCIKQIPSLSKNIEYWTNIEGLKSCIEHCARNIELSFTSLITKKLIISDLHIIFGLWNNNLMILESFAPPISPSEQNIYFELLNTLRILVKDFEFYAMLAFKDKDFLKNFNVKSTLDYEISILHEYSDILDFNMFYSYMIRTYPTLVEDAVKEVQEEVLLQQKADAVKEVQEEVLLQQKAAEEPILSAFDSFAEELLKEYDSNQKFKNKPKEF